VSAAFRRMDEPDAGPVSVYDDQGVRWVVSERDAASVPGARGPRCLVFMSDTAVRRVWTYPATWRHLTADALLAVSEQR
jgi:hypothetical protein